MPLFEFKIKFFSLNQMFITFLLVHFLFCMLYRYDVYKK